MIERDFSIPSPSGRSVRLSASVESFDAALPAVVMAHGFCGFKGWGWFPELAKRFAEIGFAAIRMDFAHNGVVGDSDRFDDLEAFEEETYGKKMVDLGAVVNTISKLPWVDPARIHFFGHSMGGGAVTLFAANHFPQAKSVIGWNPVSACDRYSDEAKADLDRLGYLPYRNGRTHQELRIGKGFFDDIHENAKERDIVDAASRLACPLFVAQGASDTIVPAEESSKLIDAASGESILVAGGDHVFNCGHPFSETSAEWDRALWATLAFAKRNA